MRKMRLVPEEKVAVVRYQVAKFPSESFTAADLGIMAAKGTLTRHDQVSKVGDDHFYDAKYLNFADSIFPATKPLTLATKADDKTHSIVVLNQSIVPVRGSIPTVGSGKPGSHITSIEEVKDIIRRDPNDPRAIVLLNNLKESMVRDGSTAKQAFGKFFASNLRLNKRLTSNVVYKVVGDLVRSHRLAALLAALFVDGMLGYMAVLANDRYERMSYIYGGLVISVILGILGVFAFRIERWLQLNPGKVFLGIVAGSYTGFCAAIAYVIMGFGAFPGSSYFEVVWFIMTGATNGN